LTKRNELKSLKNTLAAISKILRGTFAYPFFLKTKTTKKLALSIFKTKKIGDAKISGEVMLPGNAYYDKNGKFLGYYE